MEAVLLLITKPQIQADSMSGYTVGGIIAVLLLAYLLYALMKPEKF
jgi:K+-transporting ATPase KdpF subunit